MHQTGAHALSRNQWHARCIGLDENRIGRRQTAEDFDKPAFVADAESYRAMLKLPLSHRPNCRSVAAGDNGGPGKHIGFCFLRLQDVNLGGFIQLQIGR